MARNTTQEASADRPVRTPLSKRNRLAIKNKEAGYHYRIVNDVDDRVALLVEAGWELVPKAAIGAVGDRKVDNTSSLGSISHFSVGQDTRAVVMRIKEEWAKEDARAKQQEIDELESTMRQTARKNADYGDLLIS